MTQNDDIAIIGMAGLFPGAKDINSYWQNILNKVYNVREAPDDWAEPYFDPNSNPGEDLARIYTRQVGLLGELAEFNPLEFGIPPTSVDGDPSHFLSLKLARDALKDAGYLKSQFNREKTGIILGRGSNPNRGDVTGLQYGLVLDQTLELLGQFLPELDRDTLATIRQELITSLPTAPVEKAPTLVSNVASGRIANRLDLMGPNYLIDAACSSSLIAVELAIKELMSGRCDMMLAGGVQASMPPVIYQLFCQLNALSRSQISPFGRQANGTLLSEGVGFLVLKRLADAQRDGDRIYALIKGVGISSDGKGLGLLAPRIEGEILAIQRAYQETGIDPSTIDLIEAHGTGIPLGDETEIRALTQVFGQRQGKMPQCAIGSVKSMIGHCIPASGVASLIKVTLSLYYKTLPPTLCDEPNPALELEKTPFYLNTEARPWIKASSSPRRAGINAFGFGGINTHAILEEYVGERTVPSATNLPIYLPPAAVRPDWPQELVALAGQGREEILKTVQGLQQLLEADSQIKLADLAFTLCQKTQGTHRLAIIAQDIPDLQKKLQLVADKLGDGKTTKIQSRNGVFYTENQEDAGQLAFLFSSEGAQYPNMLAELCLYFPQVREWFDFLDETFPRENPPSQFIFPPPTSLTPETRDWAQNQLFAGDLATESLFAASMGLYELLRDLGVECDLMVGHSAGEHIAASASGLSRIKSRAQMIEHLRNLNEIYGSLATSNNIPTGTVMSVGAVDENFLRELMNSFPDSLFLVADNCPNQVLLFARQEVSDAVAQRIKEAGGLYFPLPFDRAYHTPLFERGAAALSAHYQLIDIDDGSRSVPLYSCATTELYPKEPAAVADLAIKQWSLPVRFRETIEKLYERGVRTFIEVGAGSNLTAFVDNILKGRDYLALASNTQKKPGLNQVQELLAKLFVRGRQVNLAALYKHRQVKEINLEKPSSAPTKAAPVLNLLLPRMSLKEEFVATVRQKLNPPQPPREAAIPAGHSPQTAEPAREIPVRTAPPQVALTSEAPAAEPSPELAVSQPTLLGSPLVPAADGHARSVLLQGHFELMQEFLANQGKVAGMIFSPADEDSSQ